MSTAIVALCALAFFASTFASTFSAADRRAEAAVDEAVHDPTKAQGRPFARHPDPATYEQAAPAASWRTRSPGRDDPRGRCSERATGAGFSG